MLDSVPMPTTTALYAGLLELNRVDTTYLHVIGVLVLVARAAHAYVMRADKEPGRLFQGIGAGGSTLAMLAASIMAIASF